MRIIIITIVALLLATPAQADSSAENMVEHCGHYLEGKAGRGSVDELAILRAGYCAGAFATLGSIGFAARGVWQACVPSTATSDQLIRAFLRHMEINPGQLHQHWILPAMASVAEAFPGPCKKG